MKTILGLDLGTNSIGWALIKHDFDEKEGEILGMGSRILPMSQDILGKFDAGQTISQTAERTNFRSTRKLYHRSRLRRERLHRVLNIMGFLPKHYANDIDFENKLGQFKPNVEPKLAYKEVSPNKFEFIFIDSFNEMVEDLRLHQPNLFFNKSNSEENLIPYDWTIYYLRKKALTQKIKKEELAWIILNFNQKRGYYQLRGDEEDLDKDKNKTFEVLKVDKIVDSGEKIKGENIPLYDVYFENGWKYDKQITKPDDWINKTKEFIVTTSIKKSGEVKRSYKAVNSEEDWLAIKEKTEQEIKESNKTVGEYIYDTLLANPNQKIRGKLIRTIERKFYKQELIKIIEKQKEYHKELTDKNIYNKCIEELYKNNIPHRNNIKNRDFTYLLIDDIIFYQRPLKSQKHLISNCPFENKIYIDKNGQKQKVGIKCIAKSNPLYQEFRILQWMQILKIYYKKDNRNNIDITDKIISSTSKLEDLYNWLNNKSSITQKEFLNFYNKTLNSYLKEKLGEEVFEQYKNDKSKSLETYFKWNYVEDKEYPLNKTRGEILKYLKKAKIEQQNAISLLDKKTEQHLWHILYSVEDKIEIEKALTKFAKTHKLPKSFIDTFKVFPRIEKEYGAFSEKAIKKLLTLMRFGKYWNENDIDTNTKDRIEKIINGEFDKTINNRVRDKAKDLTKIEDFQGLPLWLASYIIYNRYSEASNIQYWKTSDDIKLLKQHSLRNPIVEQVINETLQTVKDIWDEFGYGKENFFDEIHVELGREMKNNNEDRKRITNINKDNEKTNKRIKLILNELIKYSDYKDIVRPYSPNQQEILKIYEEGVYNNETDNEKLKDIDKIREKPNPTESELERYKLWLEQGYKSPYTGKIIPLSKLFTEAYEIDHIIPQSRFFDNSLSNKVICESKVNSIKDNQLAHVFINNNYNLEIEIGNGQKVKLLSPNEYEDNVNRYFSGKDLRAKRQKLLLDEIPDSFIERQMNDTRYITRKVKSILSNIVREEGETEEVAKRVIVSSGSVTSKLRHDWGLNDIWNELITPRFERLNKIHEKENKNKDNEKNKFGEWENKDGKRVFQINSNAPGLEQLNKKRIDHRHHALDALIVACSNRNHVNYINNDNANGKDKDKPKRYDLRAKLRRIEQIEKEVAYNGKIIRETKNAAQEFYKPWDTFTQDAKKEINNIIVSFKKNNRVINKTVNHYQKWKKQPDGSIKKVLVKQTKGDNWAIRKPLHKETVFGLVNLKYEKEVSLSNAIENYQNIVDKDLKRKIKDLKSNYYNNKQIINHFKENKFKGEFIKRVNIYCYTNDQENTKVVASRIKLDDSFKKKDIFSITDKSIQNILLSYIEDFQDQTDEKGKIIPAEDLAFSENWVERMNSNIEKYNNGKPHKPIYSVRKYEKLGNKFVVGRTGNNKKKYVEAAKGTNLFFAIYIDKNGNRSYETIPLNLAIERQKQGLSSSPNINEKGHKLLFDLTPNDLVYIPTIEEQENPHLVDINNLNTEQKKQIFLVNDFTGLTIYFKPHYFATNIAKNELDTSFDSKTAKTKDGVQIKEICWKLETDRLGKIIKIIK